jgi:hypothetical protein
MSNTYGTSAEVKYGTLERLAAAMPSPELAERVTTYVLRHLPAYVDALSGVPIPPGAGSISTAEAFWLYRLAAELSPSTIVDSGAATGWSAFILAAGAPEAQILCFDPYRQPDALPSGARYFAADWWSARRQVPPDSLAVFDDHVNQRLRASQAQRLGLANVVMHDVYRVPSKSNVSLVFADLLGIAQRVHTFEPLWHLDPVFCDTRANPQMYRWLTWVKLESSYSRGPRAAVKRFAQRHRPRNPQADDRARLNWRAR